MSSINKAFILGNLGRDPEVRQTPSGQSVARFSVATSRRWTDKSGERQEKTEWHNIVVWGKMADIVGKYLNKGRTVFVEGEIQSRSYDDKDGNKRYITEINARDIQFVGGGRNNDGGRGYIAVSSDNGDDATSADPQPQQDDIPF